MCRLADLINQYCSDGVDYKPIDECLRYEQPTKYLVKSTAYDDSYDTPVLTAGQTFILGYTNETKGIYHASKDNPVIIFDDFTTASKWVDFDFKAKSSAMKMLKSIDTEKYNIRYLFYVMQSIDYTPSDHARQWISIYGKIKVPIPSIHVQEEIVRILNRMTDLKTELETELALRKKQYEYYRDNLLSLEDYDGEIYEDSMGSLTTIGTGNKPRQILDEATEYDYINAGTTRSGYCSSFNREGDVTTTPSRGQGGIGFVGYQENNFWLGPLCYAIRSKNTDVILNKYIYYWLSSHNSLILKMKNEGGTPAVNKGDLESIVITYPSIEEQIRIVSILEKLEKLTSSISDGIPAEIKMRSQQYEYYRDKLISFEN
ncbi:restriction endonuclease subunit S [Butyrivibrio sp. AE2032]|uniref:restriction endonuclease subunit S n=1 Tax=Butyrivibrio sp. AE2032 TaxID=1458463 RepID=UPI000553A9E3|nr:restriction endonuclease subunit S [Butyrivibrio sp. AE2032]